MCHRKGGHLVTPQVCYRSAAVLGVPKHLFHARGRVLLVQTVNYDVPKAKGESYYMTCSKLCRREGADGPLRRSQRCFHHCLFFLLQEPTCGYTLVLVWKKSPLHANIVCKVANSCSRLLQVSHRSCTPRNAPPNFAELLRYKQITLRTNTMAYMNTMHCSQSYPCCITRYVDCTDSAMTNMQ